MLKNIIAELTKGICGISVRWEGCVPEDKQRIYFANHTSHLDFLVFWSALPPDIRNKTRPVAAIDYWGGGGLKTFLAENIFHALLIERKSLYAHDTKQNPINIMVKALDSQDSIILFPEGTRNMKEGVGSFKSGLYHLSLKRPDVELIPVYLENLNRILPKGEFLAIPILGSVAFGAPMHLHDGETKADFLSRARQSMEELKCQ